MAGLEEAWAANGLGYWVARSRPERSDSTDDLPRLVGIGGCMVRFGQMWNVMYRLTRATWGRGLTSEMVVAALAEGVDPEMPVVAYLLEHNRESRGAAERAGLSLVWRGLDHGNPALRLCAWSTPTGVGDRPTRRAGSQQVNRTGRGTSAAEVGAGRSGPLREAAQPLGRFGFMGDSYPVGADLACAFFGRDNRRRRS